MTRIGVPVPPFFTITTEACIAYQDGQQFPANMGSDAGCLARVEEATGKKFGDPANPLLVSCRSGAGFSMPGMMDTVLNIGLNDETARGMVELTGNERFVNDSYRRLIEMFGPWLWVFRMKIRAPLAAYKAERGITNDTDLTAENLREIVEIFKNVVQQETGAGFPQDLCTRWNWPSRLCSTPERQARHRLPPRENIR